VVERGAQLPEKITDAITEALFEIRFEAPSVLPELTFIHLADAPEWKGFQQSRLPAYDIPPNLRSMEPNLKFQPLLQLTSQGDEPISVRIGHNVLSFHRIKKYVGWAKFKIELETMVDRLFAVAPGVSVSRLGLRYLNAFSAERHGVSSITDLDLSVVVAKEQLTNFVNVNFLEAVDGVGECVVRVATPNFVNGSLPADTTLFVDVDVGSARNVTFQDKAQVKDWLRLAHDAEKAAFFHLLTPETIEKLKVP
jgi:uncharacterized protein (TIGR04255 family)